MSDLDSLRRCSPLNDSRTLVRLLGLRGARPQRHGVVVCCPWHGDRDPSCSVQNREGVVLAHCFSCGEGGDVFALIGAATGESFRQVLERAAAFTGRYDLIGSETANVNNVTFVKPSPPVQGYPPYDYDPRDCQRWAEEDVAEAVEQVEGTLLLLLVVERLSELALRARRNGLARRLQDVFMWLARRYARER